VKLRKRPSRAGLAIVGLMVAIATVGVGVLLQFGPGPALIVVGCLLGALCLTADV
jgi:hypothetical protein